MRRAPVKAHVSGNTESLGLMVEDVGNLSVLEERLRRDTADVEAYPAPVLLLHHSNLLAKLGGTDGGDVPTGAGAKDYDIIMFTHAPQEYWSHPELSHPSRGTALPSPNVLPRKGVRASRRGRPLRRGAI